MQKSAAEARNKNKSGICFDYAPSVRSKGQKAKAPAESPKGSGILQGFVFVSHLPGEGLYDLSEGQLPPPPVFFSPPAELNSERQSHLTHRP